LVVVSLVRVYMMLGGKGALISGRPDSGITRHTKKQKGTKASAKKVKRPGRRIINTHFRVTKIRRMPV
jgi:hypothetical protein